ncbi:hypothetical protein Tco_1442005 [Tanacetum coccineum]
MRSENQANKHAGPKEANHSACTQNNIHVGNSEMEAESDQDYFVLPIWSSYTLTIKSSEAKNEGEKPNKNTDLKINEKPVNQEDQAFLDELERASKASSTNTVNTASTPISIASPSGGLSYTDLTNTDQDDSQIPALEDIYDNPNDGIFTNASYDDEGAMANFTNLETTVNLTPKTSHLHAVKRIFRYLKGKPKLGLWYPRVSSFNLEAYLYSDYGGANLDRKSITGEAEYVATANCCRQVLWIQNQMLDYGFNFMNTKIYIDNESTICIVKNPVFHSKTKHIEIRHHFIKVAYEKKLIQVIKIHTDDNKADLLTKAFDVNIDRTKLSTARPKLSTDSTKIESMKLEAMVEEKRIFKCWFHYDTTNGHQFTMSNRHQEWASPEQTTSELASPKQMALALAILEQTATGKEISNPFMAGSLPKTTWPTSWYCCVAELLRCYDDDKD